MAKQQSAAREPVRETAPAAARAPMREPVRATERVRGSDGIDKYNVPKEILARLGALGWDLQWNVDSVLGKPDPQARTAMEVQGWASVEGDMWDGLLDGMFMPKGYKGEIIVDGLVLQARPIELSQQAKKEELEAARRARFVEEAKIQAGTPDGVNLDMLNPNHGSARAKTFLNKERIPSMPIQD